MGLYPVVRGLFPARGCKKRHCAFRLVTKRCCEVDCSPRGVARIGLRNRCSRPARLQGRSRSGLPPPCPGCKVGRSPQGVASKLERVLCVLRSYVLVRSVVPAMACEYLWLPLGLLARTVLEGRLFPMRGERGSVGGWGPNTEWQGALFLTRGCKSRGRKERGHPGQQGRLSPGRGCKDKYYAML